MHKEFGFELVNRFVQEAARYGQADAPPKMFGDRDLNVLLSPLPRNKRAKDPRQLDAGQPQPQPQPPPPAEPTSEEPPLA
jgi:hypothetical protein